MKKKILIIILFLVTLVINVNVVKALSGTLYEKTVSNYAAQYKYNGSGSSITAGGSNGAQGWQSYQMNIGGTTYQAFCVNPGTPEVANVPGAYECNLQGSSDPYTAGLNAIMANGSGSSSAESEKSPTQYAVWLYNLMWKDKVITPNNGELYITIHTRFYMLKNWLGQIVTSGSSSYNSEIFGLLKKLRYTYGQNVVTSTSDISFYNTTYYFSEFNTGTVTEQEVYRLLIIGLKAAINYIDNGSSEAIFKQTGSNISINTYSKINTTTKTVKYTLEATNFGSVDSGSYINATFTCNNCAELGITYTIYVNDTEIGSLSNANILSYLNNSKNNVLKIVFTYDTDSDICDTIDYDINFKYYDSSFTAEVYRCVCTSSYCGTNAQGFDAFISVPTEKSLSISSDDNGYVPELAVCNGSCEEVESECERGNQAACTIFEDKYESNCVNCTAYMNTVSCSDTDQDLYITEGAVLTDNNLCKVDISSVEVNVLKCVVDRKDVAGNSFVVTANNYCSVSCKEDYHLVLPSEQNVNNGRYFRLTASISGTKSCYTSEIDAKGFSEDLNAASEKVKTAYNAYISSNTSKNKTALKIAIAAYDEIVNDFNSCTEWPSSMEYDFDPDIKFWYQESYMDKAITNKMETVGSITKSNVSSTPYYCDVDDTYTSCVGSTTSKTKTETVFSCTESGDSFSCSSKSISYSLAKYVKAEINVSASYTTPTQFYAIYPTGSIVIAEAGNEDLIDNSEELTNLLPVSFKTRSGVYAYTLQVENLGEYYNTGKLGRIWGTNDNSVVHTILTDPDLGVCYNDSDLNDEVNVDGTHLSNGVYVCAYKVNCPDCPVVCEPVCEYPGDTPCEEPDCPVECPNCVYLEDGLRVSYRNITTNDLNPNDREIGHNWNYSEDSITTALELKAYVTTMEIEASGEEIYEVDPSTGTTASGDSAITITLDSALVKWIKEYNDEHGDDGGYVNNSLNCYDYTEGTSTYANIFCYSTFIDELIYDGYSDKISGIDNRVIGTNSSDTDRLRKAQTQNSGYWTTWSDAKWSISTTNSLSYYKSYNEEIGIGPSWK